MINFHGKNDFGRHWSLDIPPELFPPRGSLEVAIVAKEDGITFGGELIKWEDLLGGSMVPKAEFIRMENAWRKECDLLRAQRDGL